MQDKQTKEPVDLQLCRKALANFCKGTYRMCVPAQPDDDDMVLSRALVELEAARAEIERLKAENVRVVALAGAGYEKLIEGLRHYAKDSTFDGVWSDIDLTQIARDTLDEVGGDGGMKCEQCGATDAIRIKHLPLPDGSPGHITLSDWAVLCGVCIRSESVKYTALIDAAKKHVEDKRTMQDKVQEAIGINK